MQKNISDYQKLKDKHDKEIKELQKSCSHFEGRQMDIMWASGHFSGSGLFCLNCNKRLDKPKCRHMGWDSRTGKCLFCKKIIKKKIKNIGGNKK